MNTTMTPDTIEQAFVSSQRTLPSTPFPRKHIHCVFDNPQDALQAFPKLLAAGYDAKGIHILAIRDYVEAVERGQTLTGSLISSNLDEYVSESRQGSRILVVRIFRHEQMEQVRGLLAPHHAHLMKYVDTWTTTELIP